MRHEVRLLASTHARPLGLHQPGVVRVGPRARPPACRDVVQRAVRVEGSGEMQLHASQRARLAGRAPLAGHALGIQCTHAEHIARITLRLGLRVGRGVARTLHPLYTDGDLWPGIRTRETIEVGFVVGQRALEVTVVAVEDGQRGGQACLMKCNLKIVKNMPGARCGVDKKLLPQRATHHRAHLASTR